MYWNNLDVFIKPYNKGININMRCIEISTAQHTVWNSYRLTLTWDVLKSKE